MRVLIAVEQLRRAVPGGVGTYARGLLQGLAAMGGDAPQVELLASRGPRGGDPLARYGWPVRTAVAPGPLLTRLWDRGLLAQGTGFDVVHSVSLAAPPVRSASPSVMVHDLAWREVPDAFPPRGRRWHDAALRRAVAGGGLLLAPAESTAEALRRAGARRVEAVAEGSDHLPPPDDAATDALLHRLDVAPPFLLSVGTMEPRKNLARLCEAYRLAAPRLPARWPLVVAGPAGWGDRVPPTPGVVLTGPVGGGVLSGLYVRARCLAYVPLLEGFGLPPVEAMRAGLPVLASPMPSTAGAAHEVDPRHVAAIADGLVAVATDDRLRAHLTGAGRARAATLTWEAAARRHVGLWSATC